jgi:hypothetical protein
MGWECHHLDRSVKGRGRMIRQWAGWGVEEREDAVGIPEIEEWPIDVSVAERIRGVAATSVVCFLGHKLPMDR